MSTWQDIETAPKGDETDWDGARVLLTDGVEVSCGRWDGRNWRKESDIVWGGDDGAWHETWAPTHWMPLPQPPEVAVASAPEPTRSFFAVVMPSGQVKAYWLTPDWDPT